VVTGHLAFAYAARARWPRATIVPLLLASIVPDLADFVLPQGDQCRTACGLYTHAFPAVIVLAVAVAWLAWQIWHRQTTALLSGAMVLLHVAGDLITGDKPFWPGGMNLGFGLYRVQAADFVLETALVIAGWYLLRRTANAPKFAVHPATLATLIAAQAGFDVWHYLASN